MPFPATRLRRLRINPLIRRRLSQTSVDTDLLIAPFFVRSGTNQRVPIESMPGQFQWSIDRLIPELARLHRIGLQSVLLFGIPARKDPQGSEAWSKHGIIQQAIRAIKKALPKLIVMADLCFCEYTSHGHCGIVQKKRLHRTQKSSADDWHLDNDATLKNIARAALAQADAGADVIAPSGMIDGMVRTIRQALDRHQFHDRLILSYAAKFASAFYGPFREAAGSAPQFGSRHSYQMNPANSDEALREVALDIEEGADVIMVKPALAYLDIIRRVKDTYRIPLAAYNVSGEYAMIKAAAERGWIDEEALVQETLLVIRRAGADWIITYHAADLLSKLKASQRTT